jgi:hypothetical protein
MGAISEEEALKSVRAWTGVPEGSRLVYSPAAHDAGVMAAFLK